MTSILEVHEGVTLRFYPSSTEPVRIRIGETTAQDLTCDLGPPMSIHYREDDRMTIHSNSKKEDEEIDTGCQCKITPCHHLTKSHITDFYNYFQHGIDVLLSGTTHVVKKIILHSNIVRLILYPCT